MQETKPRDYTPYGHRKVMTRGLKRYYLALLAYNIPTRLRVLRRVSKTASGADAYAARAVARYKGICEAAQFSADVQAASEQLKNDLERLSAPVALSIDDIFAGYVESADVISGDVDVISQDAVQIKVKSTISYRPANDDLPDFNFGGESERAGDIVMLSPFGMTVVDPNDPLPPGVGLGQIFREPSAADGLIEKKQEPGVLDWTTDNPEMGPSPLNDIVGMCQRMVDLRKIHAHEDEIIILLPPDMNPEDFTFCPGPDVGDGSNG